jgi:hypothetical protein
MREPIAKNIGVVNQEPVSHQTNIDQSTYNVTINEAQQMALV